MQKDKILIDMQIKNKDRRKKVEEINLGKKYITNSRSMVGLLTLSHKITSLFSRQEFLFVCDFSAYFRRRLSDAKESARRITAKKSIRRLSASNLCLATMLARGSAGSWRKSWDEEGRLEERGKGVWP